MAEGPSAVTSSLPKATTATAMLRGRTDSPLRSVDAVTYSNSSDCDTFVSDSVDSVSADSETTLFSTKFPSIRPTILKLENFRRSPQFSSITSEPTVPQPSTEQYAVSRTHNLSFSELSYSVKTGIKRGTFYLQYLCPKCVSLPSNDHRARYRHAGTSKVLQDWEGVLFGVH
jgi:hypothetical protein